MTSRIGSEPASVDSPREFDCVHIDCHMLDIVVAEPVRTLRMEIRIDLETGVVDYGSECDPSAFIAAYSALFNPEGTPA